MIKMHIRGEDVAQDGDDEHLISPTTQPSSCRRREGLRIRRRSSAPDASRPAMHVISPAAWEETTSRRRQRPADPPAVQAQLDLGVRDFESGTLHCTIDPWRRVVASPPSLAGFAASTLVCTVSNFKMKLLPDHCAQLNQ